MKNEGIIKTAKKILREIWNSYRVIYEYDYIRSKFEVNRLLTRLKKKKIAYSTRSYKEEKEDRYIFVGDKNIDSTMRVAVFGDIDLGNTSKKCEFFTSRQLKDRRLKKIHDSFFKFNKLIPLPFKGMWDKKYTTWNIQNSEGNNLFVIFLAGAYACETFSQPLFLEKIDRMSQDGYLCKILYLVDPVDKFSDIKNWFPYFDFVCGCAFEDAEKYKIHWIDTPCTKYDIEQVCDIKLKSNIYVRMQDNGRLKLLQEVYEYLASNGVKCDFHVQTNCSGYKREGITYTNNRIKYQDMIREELSAAVMLEIVTPGVGAGATLRYKEAVMYGRKLLSNNPTLSKLPCYNSINMLYFQKPEDIDVAWVMNSYIVPCQYNGEFSTDLFCEKVKLMVFSE